MWQTEEEKYDVVVIGGGQADLSLGFQLCRAKLSDVNRGRSLGSLDRSGNLRPFDWFGKTGVKLYRRKSCELTKL